MNAEEKERIGRLLARYEDQGETELAAEMMDTVLKLLADKATRGDMKMINAALKEMRYSCRVFHPYRKARKVSIYGSARTPHDSPTYQQARAFADAMVRYGYMVITGGGPGIMAAGNEGAGPGNSFGLNIRLPFEQVANEFIRDDQEKLINFRYFFTRKLAFVKETSALVCFPGGFGTFDELFETLTLMQTGRANPMPIVLMDRPCGYFWRSWERRTIQHLVGRGLINEEDANFYHVSDDVEDACRVINHFYRVYHSMRYVRDTLVFRLRHPLPDETLASINREYADILTSGSFELGSALPEERNEPDLAAMPRLLFHFNKSRLGRLRMLIDTLNDAPVGAEDEHPGQDPAGEATAHVTVDEDSVFDPA